MEVDRGIRTLATSRRSTTIGFVSVVIQYRLGAFGFLSSDEVHSFGTPNAGLLDQHATLHWVQNHISKFGGNPDDVTIAGESAGAGSVMLQAMAYGGTLNTSLFQNVIAASPYTPVQYPYNGWQPSQSYYAFAQAAGCFPGRAYGNTSTTMLDCLRAAPSEVLQNASCTVGASGTWGTWAFLPVTDGDFIQQRPSEQLVPAGRVNGQRVMTGNNANEGAAFVIPDITTDEDFQAWLRLEYPLLTEDDIAAVNALYDPPNSSNDSTSSTPFATCGDCGGATALTTGSFATGPQQRALNLYSETTFVCPSYWLASAYQNIRNASTTNNSSTTNTNNENKTAYKYQYSIPAAQHGADLYAEGLRAETPNVSPAFYEAATTMWGNFVVKKDPSISSVLANGNGSDVLSAASSWPVFVTRTDGTGGGRGELGWGAEDGLDGEEGMYRMMNWNETGGQEYSAHVVAYPVRNATQYEGLGLRNDFRVVDAWAWEGGRGERCGFWRGLGGRVPE